MLEHSFINSGHKQFERNNSKFKLLSLIFIGLETSKASFEKYVSTLVMRNRDWIVKSAFPTGESCGNGPTSYLEEHHGSVTCWSVTTTFEVEGRYSLVAVAFAGKNANKKPRDDLWYICVVANNVQ